MLEIQTDLLKLNPQTLKKAQKALDNLLERTDVGFIKLPQETELWESSLLRAKELQTTNTTLGIVGIGGSSLGNKVISHLFGSPHFLFFENVDPIQFDKEWKSIKDLNKIHWLIISKSGRTIETLSLSEVIFKKLQSNGIDLSKVSTVITERQDNPLSQWARKNNVPQLDIPLDVGGRYSILTPVGLLPLGFLNANLEHIKAGTIAALEDRNKVSEFIAHALDSFDRKEIITVFWSYSNSLRFFGDWIQQLWAESLGKKVDRNKKPAPLVSSPLPLIGVNDQHSVQQQIIQGPKDKLVIFLRVQSIENHGEKINETVFGAHPEMVGKNLGQLLGIEAEATSQALNKNSVSNLTVTLSDLDERHLGYSFMFFQLAIAGIAEALNINAFDQPGVDLGKQLTKKLLNH